MIGGTEALGRSSGLDERRELRDVVSRLAAEVYAPQAVAWDRGGHPFPHKERERLAELGLLGAALPERYGGGGRPLLDALIIIEELAKRSQLAAFPVFEASTGPARVIDVLGTDSQKERFLPPVAAGKTTIALSISEPEAGSAATDMKTRARVDGNEIVINGTKRWCTGAGHAEQYLVYVRFNDRSGGPGIGAVVVDGDTEGVSFGEPERLMGFHGIASCDIFFDDARVPVDNMIVGANGFKRLFSAFSIERLGNATMSLAIAQSSLDRSAAYVQQRQQFGRDLVEFQLVQAAIADMVMRVHAARALIYEAAERAGHGAPPPLQASVAKCFANETAKWVSDIAMQLHGGYGYSEEYELERLHRDAHGWALAGGTTNMQRLRITTEYLGRRFEQRN